MFAQKKPAQPVPVRELAQLTAKELRAVSGGPNRPAPPSVGDPTHP